MECGGRDATLLKVVKGVVHVMELFQMGDLVETIIARSTWGQLANRRKIQLDGSDPFALCFSAAGLGFDPENQ